MGGLIGTATFYKNGLMPAYQFNEDGQTASGGNKYILLHKSTSPWAIDRFFFSFGNGSTESLLYITAYNLIGTVKVKAVRNEHSYRILYKKTGDTMEIYLAHSTTGTLMKNLIYGKSSVINNASNSAIANIDDIGDESSYTEATIQ